MWRRTIWKMWRKWNRSCSNCFPLGRAVKLQLNAFPLLHVSGTPVINKNIRNIRTKTLLIYPIRQLLHKFCFKLELGFKSMASDNFTTGDRVATITSMFHALTTTALCSLEKHTRIFISLPEFHNIKNVNYILRPGLWLDRLTWQSSGLNLEQNVE